MRERAFERARERERLRARERAREGGVLGTVKAPVVLLLRNELVTEEVTDLAHRRNGVGFWSKEAQQHAL